MRCIYEMGRGQAVRRGILVPVFEGSSPSAPATFERLGLGLRIPSRDSNHQLSGTPAMAVSLRVHVNIFSASPRYAIILLHNHMRLC